MDLLLVPGFMADQSLWDDLLPLLPTDVAVHFADLNTGATIEEMAHAILATAPPRFIVLGFSMGGYVAREIAYQAPQRVAGIVLVATSARPDQPALVERRLIAACRMANLPFHGLARGAIRVSLHADRAHDAAMIERVRAMGARLGIDVFLRQSGVVRAGDVDRLATIACPALVVGADGDQLRTVEESREQAAGIPGAHLAVIANAGHMLPMEAPRELGAILADWLTRCASVPR